MAVRDEDLRMVKRRLLEADAIVGQRLQERDQRRALFRCQMQRMHKVPDVGAVLLGEIAAAVVELHHLLQSSHPTIVEVGPGELDVPQTWNLEGAIHGNYLLRPD